MICRRDYDWRMTGNANASDDGGGKYNVRLQYRIHNNYIAYIAYLIHI